MSHPQPTVFISYTREDKKAARKLYADLKKNGAEPWLDEESLLPGQKWRIAIKQAIRNSRYFLAVLSSNAVTKRGFVQKELVEALDMLDEFPESEIFVIPIRLDDCSPSHEKLRDLHWVDMFPRWEDGLKKILHAIQVNATVSSSSTKRSMAPQVGKFTELYRLSPRLPVVGSVAFSPAGYLVVTGGMSMKVLRKVWFIEYSELVRGGTILLWKLPIEQEPHQLSWPYTGSINCVAFSHNGGVIACGCAGGVFLCDLESEEEMRQLKGRLVDIVSVAFQPGGKLLAGGGKGALCVWDSDSGEVVWGISPIDLWGGARSESEVEQSETRVIRSISFSPDGRWLVLGGDGGTICLCNAEGGEVIHRLDIHPFFYDKAEVRSIAFCPDGRLIAWATDYRVIHLWDMVRGRGVHPFKGHTEGVNSIAFSPSGHFLASGSDDWTVRLWDVKSGNSVQLLVGHTRSVRSVAFSPDGQFLVSSSDDGTVRVWGVAN